MFGFEKEEAEQLGSMGRFSARIDKFRRKGKSFPVLRHYFWWLVHNILAHTSIALVPCKTTFRFHDWSSRRLNADRTW